MTRLQRLDYKRTKEGIEVILTSTTVIKKYSKHHYVFVHFNNPIDAKKEFGKFRKDHKSLD